MILTYRFRLRDKHAAELGRQARAVNYVWNFCNETQIKAARAQRKWLTGYDLVRLTTGSSKLLGLLSTTVDDVCLKYAFSRNQRRRPWLAFRGRKSLGWVPFHQNVVRFDGTAFVFRGIRYEPMHLREMPIGMIAKGGSFSQDARGRWYINVPVEARADAGRVADPVGVDLGLKSLAVLSTGRVFEIPQFYRRHERRLALAQRARKKRLAASVAAKIGNCRRDYLHKTSNEIALAHSPIIVGNVSASKLARTRFAKSVLDAGWSTLRTQLSYKSMRNGGIYLEVGEAYTSQTCSACGARPEGRPEGIAGLAVRRWECSCGAVHDRDVNAARNIARIGLDALAAGAAHERSSQEGQRRGTAT